MAIKYSFRNIIATLIVVFTLGGCLKDTEEFVPYHQYIELNAAGAVLNEQNQPLSGAVVTMEGRMTETDTRGVFLFENAQVPSDLATIKFEKEGYFASYQGFIPNEESPTFNVHLLPLGSPQTLSADQGAHLISNQGIIIDIEASSLKENGSNYTGEAQVYSNYLNPLDDDLFTKQAGGLLAENEDGKKVLLEHFGTVFLKISGENGVHLSTQESDPIIIHLPIPSSLVSSAPDMIDLWKLNTSTNEWEWAGRAARENDTYKAEVLEDGVYSVQVSHDFIQVTGKIIEQGGQVLSNALVSIAISNAQIKSKMWTNGDGTFKTYIPLKEEVRLTLENECYENQESFQIGPFLSSTDLGDIEVPIVTKYWNISGLLYKCADVEVVTMGYALVRTANHTWIVPVDQGYYSLSVFNCRPNAGFILSGLDAESNLAVKEDLIAPSDRSVRDFNIGVRKACE